MLDSNVLLALEAVPREAFVPPTFRHLALEAGDASAGWSKGETWDGILLTASVPQLPTGFAQSLAPGGRAVAVIGEAPAMEAVRAERDGAGSLLMTSLFDTQLAPMVNARDTRVFQL